MLAWFRRHAKVLMVVLGSAAMAIFGLGPVFDELARRGRGGNDPQADVIATWKGGEITRVDLEKMQRRHFQTQEFLKTLYLTASEEKGDEFTSFALPIQPIREGKREMIDDQLISRFLMAERAKLEGVVVNDAMVNDYINNYSGDAGYSTKDLDAINNKANNRYCSLQSVKEHLKLELANNMMQSYSRTGIPFVPNPTEAMELYGRSMNQVECQVIPVEVENYVSQVTEEPSAARLKELFEEGKYQFPDPTGKLPGFKIGRKANVQYLVANFDNYLQNELNKLTDEQVQKEYDRLVAEDNDLVMEPITEADDAIEITDPPPILPGDKDPAPAPGEGGTPDDVGPPPSTDATTDDKTPEKTDATADKSDATADDKNTDPKAGPEGPEKAKATDDSKATEGVKDSTDPGEPEKNSGDSDDQKDQSNVLNLGNYQYVSTIAQGEEKSKQESSEDKNAGAAEDKSKPQTPPETTPVNPTDTSDADSTKKPDPPADSGTPQENQSPAGTAVAGQEDGNDAQPKVKRKPKPLKDVVDAVKRSMAEEPARAAMEEALTKAGVLVQDHFEKLLRFEYDSGQKEAPEALDIQQIAKDYNLEAMETGLVDDAQIADDPIGQVREFMQYMVQGRPTPQLVPVGQLIFDAFSDLKLYDSKTVQDTWGSQSSYLYWLAEKAETRIPSFDECRPEVEKFWKQHKAYELALVAAESLKSKIESGAPKTMSEIDPARTVQTGAFTWFSSFGNSRYSTPIGVTNPGEDFMKTAFSLDVKQVGIAPNATKDTIYVIQTVVPAKPSSEVGNQYLANQFFKFKKIPEEVLRASQQYFMDLNNDWNMELQDTMEFKFVDR